MKIFIQRFFLKKHIFYIITILFVVGLFIFSFSNMDYKKNRLDMVIFTINGKSISTYIADDKLNREKGLSILDHIGDNEAMLFLFDKSGYYNFWMKDMKFPIDIVWLDKEKRIIYIKKNARPKDYPSSYGPNIKSLYVLEFKNGFTDDNHLFVGDKLDLKY